MVSRDDFVKMVVVAPVGGEEILEMMVVIEMLVTLELVNSDRGDNIPGNKYVVCVKDNTLRPPYSRREQRSMLVWNLFEQMEILFDATGAHYRGKCTDN